MLNKTLESLKMNKTIESLKSNKTVDKALQTLSVNKNKALESFKELAKSDFIQGIREKSEALSQVTLSEKEKIVDRLVESLLKDQELGSDPAIVRSKVKAKLFEHEKGDALFISNLKYINQVLAASMPRSLAELSEFRETIAHRLVQDVQNSQAKETTKRHEQKQGRSQEQGQRHSRSDKRPRGEKVPQRAAASHKPNREEEVSQRSTHIDGAEAARTDHHGRHHGGDGSIREDSSSE